MSCLDDSLSLFGNTNSLETRFLLVTFLPCIYHPARDPLTCKSAKETEKFLQGKFLQIFYNKVAFVSDGFQERSFRRYSLSSWIPFDASSEQTIEFELQHTEVLTDDSYFLGEPKNQTYTSLVYKASSKSPFGRPLSQTVLL